MYVPRDRYSLTMSFCVVPRSSLLADALLLGVGDVEAEQPRAGALIVIDVFISPCGMPSRSSPMWPRWTTGTPTLPTSPRASAWSGS